MMEVHKANTFDKTHISGYYALSLRCIFWARAEVWTKSQLNSVRLEMTTGMRQAQNQSKPSPKGPSLQSNSSKPHQNSGQQKPSQPQNKGQAKLKTPNAQSNVPVSKKVCFALMWSWVNLGDEADKRAAYSCRSDGPASERAPLECSESSHAEYIDKKRYVYEWMWDCTRSLYLRLDAVSLQQPNPASSYVVQRFRTERAYAKHKKLSPLKKGILKVLQ